MGAFNPRVSQSALQAISNHILEQYRATQRGFFRYATYLFLAYDKRNQLMLKCSPYLTGSKLLRLDLQPGLDAFRWTESQESEQDEALASLSETFPLFAGTAPNIRYLEGSVRQEITQPLKSEAETKLITYLLDLRSLRCEVLIDVTLIIALSRFSRLQTLNLIQSLDSLPVNPPMFLPATSFPVLTELDLKLRRVGVITPLLNALRGSHVLQTLNMYVSHVPEQDEMVQAFAAVGQIRSLKHFFFDRRWPSTAFVLDKTLISTLLPLHSLTRLKIHAMHRITLVDGDLLEMAEAWPSLESFSIFAAITPECWEERCTITLTGASAFYRACPYLTSLAIDVSNSWNVTSAASYQLPFPPRTQESTVTFGYATRIPSLSVNRWVSLAYLLFPSLEGMFSENNYGEVPAQFRKYQQGDWEDLTPDVLHHLARLFSMGDSQTGTADADEVLATIRSWFIL